MSRLKVVLAQDRTGLDEATLTKIRKEIQDVISKYVTIDLKDVQFDMQSDNDVTLCTASFPLLQRERAGAGDWGLRRDAPSDERRRLYAYYVRWDALQGEVCVTRETMRLQRWQWPSATRRRATRHAVDSRERSASGGVLFSFNYSHAYATL